MQTLHETLSQQLNAHQQINELLQQLRLAVVNGNTSDIQNLNQKLLAMGTNLKQLEENRQQQVSTMGFNQQTSLKDILPRLAADERNELQAIREQLTATIHQVQQERDATRGVLAQSNKWVRQTIGIIAEQLAPKSQSYGPTAINSTATYGKNGASSPNNTKLNDVIASQNGGMSIIERKA